MRWGYQFLETSVVDAVQVWHIQLNFVSILVSQYQIVLVLPNGCCGMAYDQAAVMVMEDSEAFNAGRGSKLTVSGVETFLQL